MIEQGLGFYLIVFLILSALIIATNLIPFYGFSRKRWKGLAIGCLVQPFIAAIISLIVICGVYFYQKYEFRSLRKAAMVSVKEMDAEGNAHFWHMKPDEECFYEFREKDTSFDYLSYIDVKLFDVVPLDSVSVCVDDHIVVKFDTERRKVTAMDYDEPMEVVNVDWEKVEKYFQGGK